MEIQYSLRGPLGWLQGWERSFSVGEWDQDSFSLSSFSHARRPEGVRLDVEGFRGSFSFF